MMQAFYVLFGFVLGIALQVFDRRRRRRAHMAALGVEIDICERLVQTYWNDHVGSPLYRLPTTAFAAAFPNLLSEGALSQRDVDDLDWFSIAVQEFNRGLDNADRAAAKDDEAALSREAGRLRLKCVHFLEDTGEQLQAREGHEAYVVRARRAVGKKSWRWWRAAKGPKARVEPK